ncbi:NADP-dependent oxidoreductase [Streptomyces graminifolii]|uniref:NADP-dependent oxidoreductase n=1 Tax=Streptomyces graminifolii TaxID=1266771 RepID=UPI00405A3BD2
MSTALMRAVGFTAFGGPEVVSVAEVPVPEPGPGQVLVRVSAAPLHFFDRAARSGALRSMLAEGPRYVLGWDMCGTVHTVGPGVVALAPGDPVVGMVDWLTTRTGTQAEYAVLDASALAPAPAGTTPAAASTLPLNALTATQALDLLRLDAGRTLAVTGAGGAVGGYVVELAKDRGLRVVALSASRDEGFLTGLGAVFVPRSDDPAGALLTVAPEGVDGLVDGASLGDRVLPAVRDGGGFVAVRPPATPEPQRGIRTMPVITRADGAQLRSLVDLVDKGRLTLRVAHTFAYEEARLAHEQLDRGGQRGRLVLLP